MPLHGDRANSSQPITEKHESHVTAYQGRLRAGASLDAQRGRPDAVRSHARPSLHNSQPWEFGVSDRYVEIYLVPSRRLPDSDASGRSQLVSCGAALFNLRVAAAHLGMHPRVDLLPDEADPR